MHTNHHLTSQLPSKESVAGKFTGGENILKTRSERIDFVTGSGKKMPNVFVLARQSALSIAGVVLGGIERVGEQSAIHRRRRRFQAGLFRDAWNATRRLLRR